MRNLVCVLFACGCGAAATSPQLLPDGGGVLLDGAAPITDGDAGGACPAASTCGAVCCNAKELCVAGACRPDCGAAFPCGAPGSEVCCASGDACVAGACVTPGVAGADDWSCAAGERCEPTLGRCLPAAPSSCPAPAPATIAPVAEWTWTDSTVLPGYNQVMMQPLAADLDGDGVSDVVFSTFLQGGYNYFGDGVLRALSGADGRELWTVSDAAWRVSPSAQLAIADLDGDGHPEVLACGATTSAGAQPLFVFAHDGTPRFATSDPAVYCGYSGPAVANLDQTGAPEIVLPYAILDATGATRVVMRSPETSVGYAPLPAVADVDGDGFLDVVAGNAAWDRNGKIIWTRADLPDGFPAIADLDLDGKPEVVAVASSYVHALDGATGADRWKAPFYAASGGGGPPTIGVFDGGGLPEIGVAGTTSYYVIHGADGTLAWSQPIGDFYSSVTGSAAFDLDGDGAQELFYGDNTTFQIFHGAGAAAFSACNTSGTLWESPTVADLDGDGSAEVIVFRNDFANVCVGGAHQHGVIVYGDPARRWGAARRIWNQYGYHVTNVNADATVPLVEEPHWKRANGWRANAVTGARPDLAAGALTVDESGCPSRLTLTAEISNGGGEGVAAGARVRFFRETPIGPQLVVEGTLAAPLLPGQRGWVSASWDVPKSLQGQRLGFHAALAGVARDCDAGDDVTASAQASCGAIE